MSAPIEKTTSYATTVSEITEAWTFVMDRLDRVGPDPSVTIKPIWVIGVYDEISDPRRRQFEVVVSGMITEGGSDV